MNLLADTLMCPSSGFCIGPDATLREAACQLLQESHSVLFAVDTSGRLIGQITESDLLEALFSGAAEYTLASNFARPVNRRILNTDSASSARSLLYESHTDSLPVTDADGLLLGIVSRSSAAPQANRNPIRAVVTEFSCETGLGFSIPTVSPCIFSSSADDHMDWALDWPPRRRRSRAPLRIFNPDETRPLFLSGTEAQRLLHSTDQIR
jgi:CBS-domain-containing membrane protein